MATPANGTQYAPLWVSEPNGRGTWGILYSCVFTLSLCVWSAIHLNVPAKDEGSQWQWLRKTKWVFIAIFAPEVVLYSAFQQYYLARRFCKEMKNIYRGHHHVTREDEGVWWERGIDRFFRLWDDWIVDNKTVERARELRKASQAQLLHAVDELNDLLDPGELDEFSMTYGYFVVMGGFVIDVRKLYDEPKLPRRGSFKQPRWWPRLIQLVKNVAKRLLNIKSSPKGNVKRKEKPLWLTITPRGVIEFAKVLEWEDFSSQFCIDQHSIEDKSKADGLTKLLVTLQVFWAILNSISRVTLGYSISVLEIHTLVHAACALIMYFLWWKKPLDIETPQVIKAEAFEDKQAFLEKLALMLVRHPGSAYAPFTNFVMPDQWKRYESWEENNSARDRSWPDGKSGCEAAFLWFDPSHSTIKPEETQNFDDRSGSPSSMVSDNSVPPDSTSLKQHPDQDTSFTDVPLDLDRIEEQISFEEEVGSRLQLPQSIGPLPQPASVYRVSPLRVESAQTLSTGDFLESGIGPAALITMRVGMWRYRFWSSVDSFEPKYRRFWISVFGHWRPFERSVVEIDDELIARISLPLNLFGIRKLKRKNAYFHKVTMQLSRRDVLRWNLACSAFQAELAQAEELAESAKQDRNAEKDQSTVADLTERTQIVEVFEDEGGKKDEHRKSGPSVVGNEKADDQQSDRPVDAELDKEKIPPRGSKSKKPSNLLSLQQQHLRLKGAAAFNVSGFSDRSHNLDIRASERLTDARSFKQAKSYFGGFTMGIMGVVSAIYAGIHLALWNHDFPTRVELLLWRISGITLAVPGIFLAALLVFVLTMGYVAILMRLALHLSVDKALSRVYGMLKHCFTWMKPLFSCIGEAFRSFASCMVSLSNASVQLLVKIRDGIQRRYDDSWTFACVFWTVVGPWFVVVLTGYAAFCAVIVGPFIGGALLYVFARVYIVAESFLSLRHVPVGVYQDVSWAQYIPHL